MYDAVADLLLGGACAVCARAGRALCWGCAAQLPTSPAVVWPSPTPAGLAVPLAAGPYDGALRAMIVAHKEHGVLTLAGPMGDLLAAVVATLLVEVRAGPGAVALVPVPSRAAVVRRRGHDPMLRVARRCAGLLRRHGVPVLVTRALRTRGRVRDQAGLAAADRHANLAGAFACRRRAAPGGRPVVVVDDVLTTGATAREAQRALEEAGHAVLGIATVAATRRRGRTGAHPALPL